MIRLQGYWFDGKSSQQLAAYLQVQHSQVAIYSADDKQLIFEMPVKDMDISSRVGSTPRYCYFPNGGKFETLDHEQVDKIVATYKPSLYRTFVHKLESHLGFVAVTVVIVMAMAWASVQYGLPAASRAIAMALPQSVMNRAATETMQILDKFHFAPSKLPEAVQNRVLKHFDSAIQDNKHLGIKVLFLDGKSIGANAFALPDGTVVFTDQIVELSDSDDELLAVLAHEIGHVEYRHSLRGIIQASALSFALTMLVGDVSAMGDLLVNLPIMLTTSAYSRDFEREADDHSLLFLDKHNIPRHNFIDLMEKLSNDHYCRSLVVQEESLFDWYKSDKTKDEPTEDSKEESTATDMVDGKKPESQQKNSDDDAKKKELDKNKLDKKELDKKDGEKDKAEDKDAVNDTAKDKKDSMTREAYESLDKQARRDLCSQAIAKEKAKGESKGNLLDYFSSHPATEERLEKFRKQPQVK
jgi:Zn-dependent protease with chaperone function